MTEFCTADFKAECHIKDVIQGKKMSISREIKGYIGNSSFIRKMFEEGNSLKKIHGSGSVYDFTIGNPYLKPPSSFKKSIINALEKDEPGFHSYMANAGYDFARAAVAGRVSAEQKTEVKAENIIMTCGAGGALNVVLRSILNRGDNVITSIPYFVEYKFYVANYGGEIRFVPSKEDFDLDIDEIEKAVDSKTAAVLINSPNNPSGMVYPEKTIKILGEMLKRKSMETGQTIYLLCDEPYRKIVFDGIEVPPVFPYYENTLIVTSCSKDLSIPGERIGWITVNSSADEIGELTEALVMCNRILGFVNAPALMQRAVAEVINDTADMGEYQRKKDALCSGLRKIGYDFVEPKGTFYLFVKAPGGDDLVFIDLLKKELVLAVPGSGFGMPGYFRLAFCVADNVISGSMKGFEKAYLEALKKSE